jgi:hypothetical protein
MKNFLEILTNIRIATSEVGVTLVTVFLVFYGMYKAWQEFIVKRFK